VANCRRSLVVPLDAGGLLPALVARWQGDEGLFDAWIPTGFPVLRAALADWLGDSEAAKDLADTVLENAFLAVNSGTVVERELPWLARVARNALADDRRERRRRVSCSP
jgi:DNA-directed RNA polymerase specialized sigma24 family protein